MKALSQPNRLEIYLRIARAEKEGVKTMECRTLLSCLKIGAPTLCHHLKELTNAGLVETERDGKFLVIKAVPKVWAEVKKLFPY